MSDYPCPACGSRFSTPMEQCPRCGAMMSGLPESRDPTGTQRKFLIVFVAIVAICALAIILLPR